MTEYEENSFNKINRPPEWITIDKNEITRKIWSKYGTITNYLINEYGQNDWRFIFIFKGKIISKIDIIALLTDSFKLYLEQNYDAFIDLVNTVSIDIKQLNFLKINTDSDIQRDEDSTLNLVYESLRTALKEFQNDFDEQFIYGFLQNQKTFTYTIPFIQPQEIQEIKGNNSPWLDNSIESFLRNNMKIQVRLEKLEKSEISIAIFLRSDLKLGKGKKGAQLSHGAVSLLFQAHIKSKFHDLFLKDEKRIIYLYLVKDLKDLLLIEKICQKNNINNYLIADAGHTQIDPGTKTCIAVGPLPSIWLKILASENEAKKI